MDCNPYYVRLTEKAKRLGVKLPKEAGSASETPKTFSVFMQTRADKRAVKRGDYPRKGKGWIVVAD